MTITGFSGCKVDRKEYGRYARQTSQGDLGRIVVTGTGIDGQPGDVVVYSLINQHSGRAVARREQPYDSMMSDENSVTFDLETDCKDEFGLFRAIRGTYVARVAHLTDPAYLTPTIYADSAPFHIRIVTAAEVRDRWLFGMRLFDFNRLVADDPGITGVVVTGATGIQEGAYPLRFIVETGMLAVGSNVGGIVEYGIPVKVDSASAPAVQNYTLWNDSGDGYLFVTVTKALLPTENEEVVPNHCGPDEPPSVHGYALLRPAEIDDEAIGRHLDSSAETWQTFVTLAVPLEPWSVATENAAAHIQALEARDPARTKLPFDRVGVSAQAWQDPKVATRGPYIELPGRRVTNLHFLGGYYNATMVLALETADWWVIDEYAGVVEMVPNLSARLPAGPIMSMIVSPASLSGRGPFLSNYVPAFWQYAYTHGLRDLRNGPGGVIREAIARDALIPIYLMAGRAATSVYTSESFNRDGIGLSRSYASGQMGVYSAEIAGHDAWLKRVQGTAAKQIHGIIVQRV